jgi:acetylornithine/succinyldiaminopimelate/putrescine aminotransferase
MLPNQDKKSGLEQDTNSGYISKLENIRNNSGDVETIGLSDSEILKFVEIDIKLQSAIGEAHSYHLQLQDEVGLDKLMMNEKSLVEELQQGIVNFYAPATVNQYIAIAGRGPWIVTSHGAVLHDNGGYGMLGVGHGPKAVIDSMSQNWVMANVMTASFSQKRLVDRLRKEIGHTHGSCPFSKFICMNSGSESVTVGLRIADVNSNILTSLGGKHQGKQIKLLSIEDSFHGRTDRPAQMSHSCKKEYDKNLASFRDRDNLILVPMNDVQSLRTAFAEAEAGNTFIELMAIEPVQGEGSPGKCIDRDFYDEARKLTNDHGSLLLVDSIQAGFRGQGCLSVIDYDGFQDCEEPDLESIIIYD